MQHDVSGSGTTRMSDDTGMSDDSGMPNHSPAQGPGGQLLVVSRDAAWQDAVQCAAAHLGWAAVIASGPHDALTRLAVADPHYSHLLVDRAAAGDLFDQLAELAHEVACPDTDMLVLGGQAHRPARLRSICKPSVHSVIRALMASPVPDQSGAIDVPELQDALDRARIDTRYQPIVRIADRRPVKLEALARLNHPVRGTLAPDRFIPLLEDAGLATRLTELVCARALSDLSGPELGGLHLGMSVNFPLDVLLQPGALGRLDTIRLAAGVQADRIIIELTESRPVAEIAPLGEALRILRDLGYRVAIDDIGPETPNLAPLLALPFTSVKLDKDVVQQARTDPATTSFLRATIRTAKAHGQSVVAEGVETPETWAAMRDLGVDEAQGFLAARPLPLATVPLWIGHWNASPAL